MSSAVQHRRTYTTAIKIHDLSSYLSSASELIGREGKHACVPFELRHLCSFSRSLTTPPPGPRQADDSRRVCFPDLLSVTHRNQRLSQLHQRQNPPSTNMSSSASLFTSFAIAGGLSDGPVGASLGKHIAEALLKEEGAKVVRNFGRKGSVRPPTPFPRSFLPLFSF